MALTSRHRTLLRQGVIQWGGPAQCTDDIARVLGYPDSVAFFADQSRLLTLLNSSDVIGKTDLRCAILATEIVFVSDIIGAGIEWATVSGFSDEETLQILREAQREYYS